MPQYDRVTRVTTYKAVKVGNVRRGDLVVVSGVGGLGHLAVQYARIFGGTVAAVDITDEKLKLAADLGADIVIDARAEDPAEAAGRRQRRDQRGTARQGQGAARP